VVLPVVGFSASGVDLLRRLLVAAGKTRIQQYPAE
jgi:hypothetical protein